MYATFHAKRLVTRSLTPYLMLDCGQLLKHTAETVEMAQCKRKWEKKIKNKIKWDPLRLKLIMQEQFEREGEFFLVIRARKSLPLPIFPILLYPPQPLQAVPGEQTLQVVMHSL